MVRAHTSLFARGQSQMPAYVCYANSDRYTSLQGGIASTFFEETGQTNLPRIFRATLRPSAFQWGILSRLSHLSEMCKPIK